MRSLIFGLAIAYAAAAPAPAKFQVEFDTDVKSGDGKIVVQINTSLAPIGAQRFYDLVSDKFFDDAAFFRVVPNFVVQFGIAGTPAENQKWMDKTITDDPVLTSNTEGTIVFAATSQPNSRTTQLFINYADNSNLDSMGFAPFGSVTKGMDVAKAIFNPTPQSSGGVDQGEYESKGSDWIKQAYPGINFITKATITTLE
eukprot:Hpha_TRINITY_DN11669_c1_g1::TRINITY_DN11669_c1_g1_i1::g.49237::m.49237